MRICSILIKCVIRICANDEVCGKRFWWEFSQMIRMWELTQMMKYVVNDWFMRICANDEVCGKWFSWEFSQIMRCMVNGFHENLLKRWSVW